jgi:hypothetical protein
MTVGNRSVSQMMGLRGLPLDQFCSLTMAVKKVLSDHLLRVVDIHDLNGISGEHVGAMVGFLDTRFRTKSIPSLILSESNDYRLSGDLLEDPHMYFDDGSRRIYLPINPLWITTDTAFCDFRPHGGVTSLFSGIGILKYLDANISVITPLLVGIRNYVGWKC